MGKIKDCLAKRKHNKKWNVVSSPYDLSIKDISKPRPMCKCIGITAKEFCDNIKPF